MAQVKKKKQEGIRPSTKRSSKALAPPQMKGRGVAHEVMGGKLWEEEVQKLKGMRFSNLEEAIQAFVNGVARNLGFADEDDRSTQEFLHELVRLDPEIQELLKRVLEVRE